MTRSSLVGGILATFILAFAPLLHAQDTGGVDGRVSDPDGRPLRAVSVLVEDPATGAAVRVLSTDDTGYYRAEPLAPGPYRIRFVRLGYGSVEEALEIEPGVRTRLDIEMAPTAILLEGIAVEGERSRNRARFQDEAGITTREVTQDQIRLLPGLAESDPVRAIEFLPGVVAPTDFSGSFNVRGGSADQNLILLDGFPLFNPFHLGGVFSVFNADLVDRVELSSGGFPAEYGGRVSSVLRVESDPGPGEFQVDGGISLLAARAAVAGGIGDTRYRVALRRSYVDQLLRPIQEIPYVINDLQGVVEHWSDQSRWTLTGYAGHDDLDLGRVGLEDFPLRLNLDWGNRMIGGRWLRPLDRGGSLEANLGYTRFATSLTFPDFDDSRFESRIGQVTLRGAAELPLGGEWTVKSGAAGDHFRWRNLAETGGTQFSAEEGGGWNTALFSQVQWRRPAEWIIEAGVRLERWDPHEGLSLTEPSPRLSMKRFFWDGEAAIKGSVGRYVQFLHSVRDEELPLGIDFWITAGEHVSHVRSDQAQLGVEAFPAAGWLVSLDGYYREFEGVITNNLASDPNDPGDDYLSGTGRSYGVDLFVERTVGTVDGSVSLSWLRATRTFPDFVSGLEDRPSVTYPPIFDRRIDLDLVLRFPLPGEWEGGLRWHVGSGIPYTRPLASYAPFTARQTKNGTFRWLGFDDLDEVDDEPPVAILLGTRNRERYPTYQRLDVSARRDYERSWGRISPYLDILNVYNRTNVLFYFYDFRADPPVRTGLSMFPLLPTVGVEVRF